MSYRFWLLSWVFQTFQKFQNSTLFGSIIPQNVWEGFTVCCWYTELKKYNKFLLKILHICSDVNPNIFKTLKVQNWLLDCSGTHAKCNQWSTTVAKLSTIANCSILGWIYSLTIPDSAFQYTAIFVGWHIFACNQQYPEVNIRDYGLSKHVIQKHDRETPVQYTNCQMLAIFDTFFTAQKYTT